MCLHRYSKKYAQHRLGLKPIRENPGTHQKRTVSTSSTSSNDSPDMCTNNYSVLNCLLSPHRWADPDGWIYSEYVATLFISKADSSKSNHHFKLRRHMNKHVISSIYEVSIWMHVQKYIWVARCQLAFSRLGHSRQPEQNPCLGDVSTYSAQLHLVVFLPSSRIY